MKVDATCRVFTFKEGVLSALAHDLELEVGKLGVEVADDLAIDARFDASSLRVLHPMSNGQPTNALGDGDKRKIEKTIATDVLDVRKHAEIRFTAPAPTPEGEGYRYKGQLQLHGATRSLEVVSKKQGDKQVVEVVLHQPDFGIKPYSAMLGTLKIKPDVRVRVEVKR